MGAVRIGLVGCGGFMRAHAGRLIANPDAEVVALCDDKPEQTQKFLANFEAVAKKPVCFTDMATMLKTARPDAVFIATPHTLHFKHGMLALDHGCHVYMEKPMVTASADAYALAKKVEQTGKILVVGYNSPCSPEFAYLRDAIRTKKHGKLELVIGHISQDWMRLTTGLWRQEPELSGGGQAYDSGAHLLNSLVWSVESRVAEVFAFVDNHGTKVDINSSINIRFANGVMASIVVSGNCPAVGTHMSFIFDNGKVDIDGWSGTWIHIFGADGRQVKYPHITGKQQTPDDNFIDAILGRAEPMTSPRNGIDQSELMDAIYESARTGKPAKPKSH
jgi:predicted dehydrogenase